MQNRHRAPKGSQATATGRWVMMAAGLAIGLLAAGCAYTTTFQAYPGLDTAKGAATVHVVRAQVGFGSAVSVPVYVDQFLIGRIGPGGVISTPVPVGRVYVTSMAADTILDTEPGSEYFFEDDIPVQVSVSGPGITTLTQISRERALEIAGRRLPAQQTSAPATAPSQPGTARGGFPPVTSSGTR